jgi:predicted RNase H-like nuclease (RuvC/YqgF family)
MADNEKDIPVKEQTDGSALVAYEMEPDPLADAEEEPKKEVKAEETDEEPDEDQEDSSNEQDENETDEDRERIREARREERRLKKELSKQRDATARNKISALERRNAELAERLAKVENAAASYQFAQLDSDMSVVSV